MKLYRFELLFFDGTVITGKFCVGVPLNIQSIYLSINSVVKVDFTKFMCIYDLVFFSCFLDFILSGPIDLKIAFTKQLYNAVVFSELQ